jgi:hypothetical protein
MTKPALVAGFAFFGFLKQLTFAFLRPRLSKILTFIPRTLNPSGTLRFSSGARAINPDCVGCLGAFIDIPH